MKTLYVMIFFFFSQCLAGCLISPGTLGGFETITFSQSKEKIEAAVDSIFINHPEYQVPQKWKTFDNWKERGYHFLQGYIFYFKSAPEEMYYVTYIGNQDTPTTDPTRIAIRAVHKGRGKWLLHEDFNENEKERISKRFNSEIVKKIESFL